MHMYALRCGRGRGSGRARTVRTSSEAKNATFRRSERVKACSVQDKRVARPARVPECVVRLDTSTWTMIYERACRTRGARPAPGLIQGGVKWRERIFGPFTGRFSPISSLRVTNRTKNEKQEYILDHAVSARLLV